jgi:hypothetical protein
MNLATIMGRGFRNATGKAGEGSLASFCPQSDINMADADWIALVGAAYGAVYRTSGTVEPSPAPELIYRVAYIWTTLLSRLIRDFRNDPY